MVRKASGTTVVIIAVLALSVSVGMLAEFAIAGRDEREVVPRRVQDACLLHRGRMVTAAEECIQDWRDGLW